MQDKENKEHEQNKLDTNQQDVSLEQLTNLSTKDMNGDEGIPKLSNIKQKASKDKPILYSSGLLCILSFLVFILHYAIILDYVDHRIDMDHSLLITIWELYKRVAQHNSLFFFALEIVAIFIFIASMRNLKAEQVKDHRGIIAQLAQILAFLTILSSFRYLYNLVSWISEHWEVIRKGVGEYREFVVLLTVFLMLLIGIVIYRIKKKQNQDPYLKTLFFCLAGFHLVRFLWEYAGLGNFIAPQDKQTVTEIMELAGFFICLSGIFASLIYYKKQKKTNQSFSLMMWLIIWLCLLGIAPALHDMQRLESLFREHSGILTILVSIAVALLLFWNLEYTKVKEMLKNKSGSLFFILCAFIVSIAFGIYIIEKMVQVFKNTEFSKGIVIAWQIIILVISFFVMIIFGVFAVKLILSLRDTKIAKTNLWKLTFGKIKEGKRGFLFGYFAACVLLLGMIVFMFLNWSRTIQGLLEENGSITQVLFSIGSIVISVLVLIILILFAVCQMGVYVVRTLKEIEYLDDLKGNQKKNYYKIHGLSAFLTLILTIISWYIYTTIDYTDEDAIGVAGEVFRYFAFPVIALLWYAIMYYLLTIVINGQGRHAAKLHRLIKMNAYDLAESFVYSIFVPFRLFFNFFDVLGKAMLDEEEETDCIEKVLKASPKSVKIKSASINIRMRSKPGAKGNFAKKVKGR